MFHTVEEVAELLKLSRRSVYRMIGSGRLDATKVGREWRIADQSVQALLGQASVAESRSAYRVNVAPSASITSPGRFLTTQEYLSMPEGDGLTHLIQGYYIHDLAPTVSHQELVGRLYILLHRTIREENLGAVYLTPIDVVFDHDTVLEPDLVAIRNDRRHIVNDRVRGAPDLVIEIASPSTQERDLTVKRMIYAQHAVSEYWFVSGLDRALVQFCEPVAGENRYARRNIYSEPQKVSSTRFVGLVVDLAELFREY